MVVIDLRERNSVRIQRSNCFGEKRAVVYAAILPDEQISFLLYVSMN